MSGPLPEPHVEVGTSRREWIALLAGPSLWWGHFVGVYLLAEVMCAGRAAGADAPGFSLGVIVATVVALTMLAVATRLTWTYRTRGRLMTIGLGLDALFGVAVAFTAAPALVLAPC